MPHSHTVPCYSIGQRKTQWDENSKSWYGVEYCETPEDLRDELLSSYRMNEAEKITKTRRELTEEETASIETKTQSIVAKCEM